MISRKLFLLACTSLVAMPALAAAQNVAADAPGQPGATTVQQPPVDAANAPAAPEQSPAEAESPQVGLADIVVTATRRTVALQNVPATINAVPASTLKALNVEGVLDLPSLVPGLVVTPAGGNNIYLRGIGSNSTGYNEAQSATYVDGLYLAVPAMSITALNNIDRIEVLKGPQGTLYGRNVTGGLISILTRNPGRESRSDLEIGYGNYDTIEMNYYGSTPITDNLAGNISIYQVKQSKGWTLNTFNGRRDQVKEEIAVQAKLLWEPTDSTRILTNFIFDYNDRDYGFVRQVNPGTLASDGTPNLGQYRYASRIDPKAPFHAYIGTLRIEQDLGFASLMSLTGYQTSKQDALFGASQAGLGQPVAGLGVPTNAFLQSNKTWSQELQLTSQNKDSRFEWVIGAFYYRDRQRLRLDTYNTCVGNVCATGAGSIPTRSDGRPRVDAFSFYGDGTYRIFDATRLTLGLRYNNELRGLSGLLTPLQGRPNSVAALAPPSLTAATGNVLFPGQPFFGFPNGIPTSKRWTDVTYRVVLAQDIGPNLHLYASHNYGFKSGAFNANAFNNPPVNPEAIYAYEAGFKSELFERRLRLNAAYFHYDYKDIQVRSSAAPAPPGLSFLLNIAAARYDGVDVDFSIAAAPGLTINGGFEYLDASYKNYPGASCITPVTGIVSGVLVGLQTTVACNLAGNQVANAPEFSGTLGFIYAVELDVGKFSLSANDRFNVRYPITAQGTIVQPKAHVIDASLLWTSPDKRYDINVWARNLTDNYTFLAGTAGRDLIVGPGAPRTYGVTAGVHF